MIEVICVIHVKGHGYFYVEETLNEILDQVTGGDPIIVATVIGPQETVATMLCVTPDQLGMIVTIPKAVAFPQKGA